MKERLKKIQEALFSAFEKIKAAKLFDLTVKIKDIFSNVWKNIKIFLKTTARFTPPAKDKVVSFVVNWWHWVLGGLFAFIVLYYPVGALLIHRIDDNPHFMQKHVPPPETPKIVLSLYSLIDREINQHVWTPNLPFIFPSSILDNMPSYQQGIMASLHRITQTLSAQNPTNLELKIAAELLGYPATKWYISSWKPSIAANKQYQSARYELMQYEEDVAEKTQTFNSEKTALLSLLQTISSGIGADAAIIKQQVAKYEKRLIDTHADNVFYNVKGQIYVYYVILRDMKEDFKSDFENEAVKWLWQEAEASLKQAIMMQPLFVMNGSPETQFMPNHLLGLGFYITHAQTYIQEMCRILQ